MMLRRVDLPEPDWPTRATISPARTSSETERRTGVRASRLPYALSTLRRRMIGSSPATRATVAHATRTSTSAALDQDLVAVGVPVERVPDRDREQAEVAVASDGRGGAVDGRADGVGRVLEPAIGELDGEPCDVQATTRLAPKADAGPGV